MRFRPARVLGSLLPLALVASTACKEALPPTPPEAPPAPSAQASASPAQAAPPGPALLPARLVAELDDENATPFFARAGKQGLVVFASKGRLVSQLVGVDGDPTGLAPVDLGVAPHELALGALKPVGDGWVFAWAEVAEKNHTIKVLALDAAGKPRGAPAFAAQTSDDLGWLDVLPNAKGALLFWELRKDDRAELGVAPLVDGKPGTATTILKDALGWEVIPTDRGAAIASVMPTGPAPAVSRKAKAVPADDARGKLGRVQLVEVDPAGKASAPVAITSDPTAQIDVDLVEVEGRYVVAWTDEREIDATVFLAGVDPGGKVAVAPHRATPPAGEQVLVALVGQAGPGAGAKTKKALFAWEDLLRAPGEGRLIHLATVTKDAQVGADRATLTFALSGPPDLALDGDSFAAVTLAPVPVPTSSDPDPTPGKEAAVWPVYVRFGPDLSVVASEPVRAMPFAATDGVPYLTRSLSCFEGTCTTLASGSGPKAPLAFVSLEKRPSNAWRPAASKDSAGDKPHATSVTAIYDGDHLADVSATEVPGGGGNALAAWVTYYLDGTIGMAQGGGGGKKGKKAAAPQEDPFSATVAVRSVSPKGELGPVNVLSRHGVSFGGVSIAGAPGGKRPEAAVAWVAKAKGEPQVFVTKLGANGEKLEEKGVTVVRRKKKDKDGLGVPSECSDVAIAWAPGENEGWVVAWVDTRDGNAEVYVAKMDRSLKKIVPDRRITDAPGDASDVQIAVRGKETFLIWSDARNHPDQGRGDVYLARLDTASLKRIGEETRLFASEAHSRSPLLATTPNGLAAVWIEEPLDLGAKGKANDAEAGVRFAELDERGVMKGSPTLLRADARSAATSVTLTCSPKSCRGAITSAIGENLLLGGFQMAPGQPPGAVRTLATLQGGVTEDASPVFASPSAEWLFFADDAVGGSGRLRWMSVAW
jgi:hypothetical protein